MAQFTKTGLAAANAVASGRADGPDDPQQWAADQQRVQVLTEDLTQVQARGRVTAYHPESVSVRLPNGNLVHVPVARIVPVTPQDLQSETDEAAIEALGGGQVARTRYNALLAAGFTVTPPPG